MHRPHNSKAVCLVVLIFGLTFACGFAEAQKLIKPVNGATVREDVRIAVEKASVPDGGYISIYIDKHFIGATAGEDENGKPAAQAVVFTWNSKAPFIDMAGQSEEIPKDGKHDLKINIHDTGGNITQTIDSAFMLANKAPRLSQNDKVKLAYNFRTGVKNVYKVRIGSRLGSNYASDDSSTIPIMASYEVSQTIEDARSDGSALMSYRIGKGGSYQMLGQVSAINEGKAGSSVYKEIDRFGQVIRRGGVLQDNVLAKKGRRSLPDLLIQLPRTPVKIGETWKSNEKEEFRIEGLGKIVRLDATNTLEDLEYEKGLECAKIKSVFTGQGSLLSADKSGASSNIDGEGIFYISLKTGKLVKSIVTLKSFVTIDTSGSASSSSGPSGSTYSGEYDEDEDGGGGAPVGGGLGGGSSRPSFMPSSSSSSSSDTGGATASGNLRVIIETEL